MHNKAILSPKMPAYLVHFGHRLSAVMNMKKVFPILPPLLFTTLLLTHPSEAAGAVREGLALCFQTVIPSLFPFLAVSALLLRLGLGHVLHPLCAPFMVSLFGLRGICALPLITGLVGGYPTGAKSAAELYDQGVVTKSEAELLLGFCNNCGPGFLLGYVGAGVLGSSRAGAYLFLVHAAAALLTGMILCRLPRKTEPAPLPCGVPMERATLSGAVTASVSSALTSVLSISAYVVLFRTAAALFPDLPAMIVGAVEMVSGMAALSPDRTGFVLAAAMAGWGGVSVHCQTISAAGGLSMKYHTAGKAMQTVFSALLALVTAPWLYG